MKNESKKPGERNKNIGVIAAKWLRLTWLAALLSSASLLLYTAFAVVPPGLTIAPLGSNQFAILITNSLSTTNYELYWTPVLGDDENYPFTLYAVGSLGQSNFVFNGSSYPVGFFQMTVEQVYNGIPDYELADPNNPSLGALSITIDSPTNGMNLN